MTPTHTEPRHHPRYKYDILIDGPSIDRTLGRVLGQVPDRRTRPDWRRVDSFVGRICDSAPSRKTFVMHEVRTGGAESFLTFLRLNGFAVEFADHAIPGRSSADVIREIVIQQNNDAVPGQEWEVIVGTNNEGLIADLPRLAARASRIVVFGFSEDFPNSPELDRRISFCDIEDDAHLFAERLPREELPAEDRLPDPVRPPAAGRGFESGTGMVDDGERDVSEDPLARIARALERIAESLERRTELAEGRWPGEDEGDDDW